MFSCTCQTGRPLENRGPLGFEFFLEVRVAVFGRDGDGEGHQMNPPPPGPAPAPARSRLGQAGVKRAKRSDLARW